MDIKVRNRTKKELIIRKKEFLKICDFLDKINLTYFLNTGILLGAIREKNFIKWDWDVEISVMSDDFYKNFDLIYKNIKKKGFKIIQKDKKKDSLKIDFFGACPKETTRYTIFSWNYSIADDVYWRKDKIIPSKYLKKFSKINFFGRKFNAPNNPKQYLKYTYGNWKKPFRTANKDLYLTTNFKRKELSIKIFIKKVLIKVYSYLK